MDAYLNNFEYQIDLREKLNPISIKSAYPIDAYLLVLDAYTHSTRYFEEIPNPPFGTAPFHSMDGYYLSYCVLKFSYECFVVDAEETLHEWNIRNSEDIGNIVYDLISVGLMEQQEGDSINDFQNLFVVTQEIISNVNL